VKAVGAPHPELWDERLYDRVVQTDGNMAVVWAPYSFFPWMRAVALRH